MSSEGERRKGGREGDKRSKERRKRSRRAGGGGGGGRRKHRRTAGSAAAGTPEGGGLREPVDEEPIPNHVPEGASGAVATAGDSVGVANLPAVSRVVADGIARVEPLSQSSGGRTGGGGGRGGGKGGGTRGRRRSVGDFRMVRIKEEPMDEDMASGTHTYCHFH